MKFCCLLLFLLSACASKPQPFLFRASHDWRAVILFGTIHRGVSIAEISPLVRTALASADHAYFETDLIHDPNRSALRLLIRPGESTLDRRLSASEFHFLDDAIAKAAPDLSSINRKSLRPFTALTLLQRTRKVELDAEEAQKYFPASDVDLALLLEAQHLHTPIVISGDATNEKCFDDIDRDSLEKIHAIFQGKNSDEDFNETRALARAYKSGSAEKVSQAAVAVEDACAVADQNQRAAHLIANLGGLAFISVDVGQLVSLRNEPSLLDLLHRQGFAIQRLSPPEKPSSNH